MDYNIIEVIHINNYLEVLKEVKNLIKEYSNYNYDKALEFIKLNTTHYKYSKGGLNRRYGLYEFSIVDQHCICNAPYGREIKKIDKGYNYKYSYSDEKLIFIEKYDNCLVHTAFFLYYEDRTIILYYDKKGKLLDIDKYEYDNKNRITRRLIIEISIGSFDYKEEIYEYVNEILTNVYWNQYRDTMDIFGRVFYEIQNFKYCDNNLILNNNKCKLIIIEDRDYIRKKGLEEYDNIKWQRDFQVVIKKVNNYIGE